VPAVLAAAAAIRAGFCQTVLIVGGEAGVLDPGRVASYTRPDNEFVAPYGSSTPAQFALVAARYLHRFPAARQGLAAVAATIRSMGSKNPDALMFGRGSYTADDVLAAPTIVEPFTRLELCLSNEGAAAIVMTSMERARECARPPIAVLGGACEWARQEYVEPPRYDEIGRIGTDAAARAFTMADVSPTDVDVLALYDPTSFEIVRQLEVLGYCDEGDGAAFAAEAGIGLGGRFPVNPDGGRLSHGHIGLGATSLPVIEAVRQLRGEAHGRQVENARVAVATGAGSGAQYWNVLILGQP
jgi:acetyl-CoA acetyltransferase